MTEQTRAEEARLVIEAVKVLDRYGFTTVARLAVQAGSAIANGEVNHAPRVKAGAK
jgi:hypothetical protein